MPGDKFLYITTPVFYPNDKPHLGHAFTVVIADCLKRYYSCIGYRCWMSVGTDEHGEKIFLSAQNANVPVEEFVESNVFKFKELWSKLGIKYDRFVRTSDYSHKNLVRKIFEQFQNTNQIFFDDWRGWYCNSCEENYSDRSIGKTAVCKLGHPLIMQNEKSYFLRVGSFKSWLLKEYKELEEFIIPERYKKEMINNFINDLDDLSISRENLKWGIRVPENEDYSIYVWFDALISYLTALNYGNYGKTNTNTFQTFWENPNSKIIHVIGKEICRFHSIYWPVMLQNLNIRLFDTLLVHGWLLMNDEKMSKSKRNVIDPNDVLERFPREVLRLYLIKMNFFNDLSVNFSEIVSTYNSLLANTYGNLVSRFYGIMSRKFALKTPDQWDLESHVEISRVNADLEGFLNGDFENFISSNTTFMIVDRIFDLFRAAGKLIEKMEAWSLDPGDGSLKTLVVFLYRLLSVGTWVLEPILIDTAPKILEILCVSSRNLGPEYLGQTKWLFNKQLKPLEENFFPRIKEE